MHVTKRLDLELLEQELTVASVLVNGLGLTGTDTDAEVYTYADGATVDLPPEAGPVVEAHVAPPVVAAFLRTDQVQARLRTTDATFQEITRIVTTAQTVYRATISIIAIDAGDGTTKDSEARITFKRLAAAPTQVGATVVLSVAQDAAATGWAIQAQPDGMDLRIGVRGAAGKTVDWVCHAQIDVFRPGGL